MLQIQDNFLKLEKNITYPGAWVLHVDQYLEKDLLMVPTTAKTDFLDLP